MRSEHRLAFLDLEDWHLTWHLLLRNEATIVGQWEEEGLEEEQLNMWWREGRIEKWKKRTEGKGKENDRQTNNNGRDGEEVPKDGRIRHFSLLHLHQLFLFDHLRDSLPRDKANGRHTVEEEIGGNGGKGKRKGRRREERNMKRIEKREWKGERGREEKKRERKRRKRKERNRKRKKRSKRREGMRREERRKERKKKRGEKREWKRDRERDEKREKERGETMKRVNRETEERKVSPFPT
ncbi:hypothetical protein niasHT_013573 [Heterodera trifolii]|uniref:Uncharacterized protein n=1 Tax=Heterodera trifolii TaxID=157864 RepID=A0ABD2LE40_9BILA